MVVDSRELSDNKLLLEVISIDEIIINERIRAEINYQKVEQLKESIIEVGLIHPITISLDKVLIAGQHRLLACQSIGWDKIPCQIINSDDPLALELLEIDENLIRAELHFLERGKHLARRKAIYEKKYPDTKNGFKGNQHIEVDARRAFTKITSEKTGLRPRTIQEDIKLSRDILPEVQEFIKDKEIGKKEALLIAREEPETQEKIVEKLTIGKIKKVTKAISRIKTEERRERESRELFSQKYEPRENIVCDSLENLLEYLEPNSVDLIVTDPPYPREYLPLWEVLFDKAFTVLKEGGILIAYAPHIYLPEIFRMKNNLRYVWTIAQIHAGFRASFHPSKVNIGWKPLLMFVKGKMPEIAYFDDILQGSGREKGLHNWQQALGEAESLIETFSRPKQLVVDPFLGSGTTVLAAKNTDRSFFGMDIDKTAIQTTLRRLKE